VVIESGPERSFGVRRAAVDANDIVSAMASGQWLRGPAGVAPGGSLGVLTDVVLGFAMMRDRPASRRRPGRRLDRPRPRYRLFVFPPGLPCP